MSTCGGLIVCPDFSFSKNRDKIVIISVPSVDSSDLPHILRERAGEKKLVGYAKAICSYNDSVKEKT